MRQRLLDFIHCPICSGSFQLVTINENAVEIEEGMLICTSCGYTTECSGGIVNLLYGIDPDTVRELKVHVQDARDMFGADQRR